MVRENKNYQKLVCPQKAKLSAGKHVGLYKIVDETR